MASPIHEYDDNDDERELSDDAGSGDGRSPGRRKALSPSPKGSRKKPCRRRNVNDLLDRGDRREEDQDEVWEEENMYADPPVNVLIRFNDAYPKLCT